MAVYFDSFRTEYAPQKVLSRIKSITYNISGIQDDDSIKLYQSIFSEWQENGKIIPKYFKDIYGLDEIKHNDLMSEKHKNHGGLEITLTIFLFLFLRSVVMFQILYLLR